MAELALFNTVVDVYQVPYALPKLRTQQGWPNDDYE